MSAPSADAAGQRLGRYHLSACIGGGPTGDVYRARVYGVAGMEKEYAVKRFHPSLVADEGTRKALQEAARLYGNLEHPRIAKLEEFGIDDGVCFVAVEYVDGLDLSQLIAQGDLPLGTAARLVIQIGRAVGHAHGRGLSHLGLCPSNVICTLKGDVKITDFGFLPPRLPDKPEGDNSLARRFPYLAPEQIVGKKTSAATDVYQLGVIAYELMLGYKPFKGRDSASIASEILNFKAVDTELPRPFNKFLKRAMAQAPFERFPDTGAMADALEAALRLSPAPGDLRVAGDQVRECLERMGTMSDGDSSGAVSFPMSTPPPATTPVLSGDEVVLGPKTEPMEAVNPGMTVPDLAFATPTRTEPSQKLVPISPSPAGAEKASAGDAGKRTILGQIPPIPKKVPKKDVPKELLKALESKEEDEHEAPTRIREDGPSRGTSGAAGGDYGSGTDEKTFDRDLSGDGPVLGAPGLAAALEAQEALGAQTLSRLSNSEDSNAVTMLELGPAGAEDLTNPKQFIGGVTAAIGDGDGDEDDKTIVREASKPEVSDFSETVVREDGMLGPPGASPSAQQPAAVFDADELGGGDVVLGAGGAPPSEQSTGLIDVDDLMDVSDDEVTKTPPPMPGGPKGKPPKAEPVSGHAPTAPQEALPMGESLLDDETAAAIEAAVASGRTLLGAVAPSLPSPAKVGGAKAPSAPAKNVPAKNAPTNAPEVKVKEEVAAPPAPAAPVVPEGAPEPQGRVGQSLPLGSEEVSSVVNLHNLDGSVVPQEMPPLPTGKLRSPIGATPSEVPPAQSSPPASLKTSAPARSGKSRLPLYAVLLLALGGGGFFAYQQFLAGEGDDEDTTAKVVESDAAPLLAPAVDAKVDEVAVTSPDAGAIAVADQADAGGEEPVTTPDASTELVAVAEPDAAVEEAPIDAGTTVVKTGSDDALVIKSSPPGAKVYLDGTAVGSTPVTLEASTDRHRLALILPGHTLHTADIEGSGELSIELPEITPPEGPGGIKIRCKQKNRYWVFLDGKEVGQLCPTERLGVGRGMHQIEVYDPVTDSRRAFEAEVVDFRLSVRVRVD